MIHWRYPKNSMFYLPPHPSALFGSLRGVGYPVAASIADLIDNSISAGSRDVRIAFVWRGETSRILLADDGVGMSQATLVEAMRLGCGGPSMGRSPHDLGRFGMGLKTASLAHCRRLTVVSKKANAEPSSARWDLVEISRHGEWRLETQTSHEGGAEWQWFTSRIQGTLVVWDDLDRMVPSGTRADDARAKTDFLRTAEDVAIHCGMVFHRFISTGRLRIQVGSNLDNGSYCKPWDPMLESHPDSWKTPEAHLDGGVTLRGFVLPRPERFLSKKDRDAADGVDISESMEELVGRLNSAYDEDQQARSLGLPALAKIKLLSILESSLVKQSWQEPFIDAGGLRVLALWLEPLADDTLPNLTLRSSLIGLLERLSPVISVDNLKEAKIGYVLNNLFHHPMEIPDLRRRQYALIAQWLNAITRNRGIGANVVKASKEDMDSLLLAVPAAPAASRSRRGRQGPSQSQSQPTARRARIPHLSQEFRVQPVSKVEAIDSVDVAANSSAYARLKRKLV